MMKNCDILAILVSLISTGSAFFDDRVDHQIASNNLEEGSNVTILCTIKDNVDRKAQNLTIKLRDTTIDPSRVEIFGPKQKQARVHLINIQVIPGVNLQTFRCYFRDWTGIPNQLSLSVGRQPMQPRDVTCVVYNWGRLICTWLPTVEDQKKHAVVFTTRYSLTYHQNDEPGTLDCPDLSTGEAKCSWNAGEYVFGAPISLSISASNKLGRKELKNKVFDTNQIVKPGRVADIQIVNITNRSAQITWRPPNQHNMNFSVIMTCQWHTINITDLLANHTEVTDLIPHTNYEVRITAIPVQGGFWSDPSITNFTTSQDVPEDHPLVARGAYEVGQCGTDCRNITIYYKPLHDKHVNGKGLAYTMMVAAEPPCPSSMHVNQGDMYKLNISAHHISIRCRTNCSILIKITASNAQGTPQWPPESVVVPATESMFDAPSPTVIAVDEKTIDLMWSPIANAESYTLYWCKSGISTHGCHPKHELNWKTLPGKAKQYRLQLGQESYYDNTKFALSAVVGNHSSPLSWATCTYDERQGGEVPQLEKVTHQQFTSVSVRWSLSECPMGSHRGYIQAFNLSYCQVESCPSEEQDVHKLECQDASNSLRLDQESKENTVDGLPADQSYLVKVSSLTKDGQSEWSAPICHTVTDTWFRGGAIVGVAIGAAIAGILVILGIITITYRFKSFHKWYTTGLDIKVPERHMTFSSVSSSKHLLNGQSRAAVFSRGTSLSDTSEGNSERQRAYSCSTDLGEDDVFSTSLVDHVYDDNDDIHVCKSPKGYITVDARSKHGYNRANSISMAHRALPERPLSQVLEESDKENNENRGKKKKLSKSSSKTSRSSKNSQSSIVTEQTEFPPVSHVMKNPHYAAPVNNNVCAF